MALVLLVLAALLVAMPAGAGDDYGRPQGKQPEAWDRLRAIDKSMQHDADHPEAMGEDPGDDDEPGDLGAKAPARRAAPAAPAPPAAPGRMPATPGRPPAAPTRPNGLENPIGRSPLAPEPPPADED